MPYFADLTPYTFLTAPNQVSQNLLNVGWLSRWHSFPKGDVDPKLLEELLRLCRKPTALTRGYHRCDLCSVFPVSMPLDGQSITLGNGEIRTVGADAKAYTAPTLICHYIAAHHYLPPQEFLDAIAAA